MGLLRETVKAARLTLIIAATALATDAIPKHRVEQTETLTFETHTINFYKDKTGRNYLAADALCTGNDRMALHIDFVEGTIVSGDLYETLRPLSVRVRDTYAKNAIIDFLHEAAAIECPPAPSLHPSRYAHR